MFTAGCCHEREKRGEEELVMLEARVDEDKKVFVEFFPRFSVKAVQLGPRWRLATRC